MFECPYCNQILQTVASIVVLCQCDGARENRRLSKQHRKNWLKAVERAKRNKDSRKRSNYMKG